MCPSADPGRPGPLGSSAAHVASAQACARAGRDGRASRDCSRCGECAWGSPAREAPSCRYASRPPLDRPTNLHSRPTAAWRGGPGHHADAGGEGGARHDRRRAPLCALRRQSGDPYRPLPPPLLLPSYESCVSSLPTLSLLLHRFLSLDSIRIPPPSILFSLCWRRYPLLLQADPADFNQSPLATQSASVRAGGRARTTGASE